MAHLERFRLVIDPCSIVLGAPNFSGPYANTDCSYDSKQPNFSIRYTSCVTTWTNELFLEGIIAVITVEITNTTIIHLHG